MHGWHSCQVASLGPGLKKNYNTGGDNAVSSECFLKYKLIGFGRKGQIVVVVLMETETEWLR